MILVTKLKNEIKKELPNAEFDLRNISVNGEKRGCSGFIINDGVIVYVNTEKPVLGGLGLMFQYARYEKDYKGLQNKWVTTGEKDYITAIIGALKDKKGYEREMEHDRIMREKRSQKHELGL